MSTSPLTITDLDREGAALFNEANEALATMAVRQALVLGTLVRPVDLVLCDPVARAEYVAWCPPSKLPVFMAPAVVATNVVRMRPRLRLLRGGKGNAGQGQGSGDTDDEPEAG